MQIHRARGFKARALQGSRGINGPPPPSPWLNDVRH